MNLQYTSDINNALASQAIVSPSPTQYSVASVAIADTVLILAQHYISTQIQVLQDFHAAVSAWACQHEMMAKEVPYEINDISESQQTPTNPRPCRRRSVSLDEQKLSSIVSRLNTEKEDAINFLRMPTAPSTGVRRTQSLDDDSNRQKKRLAKAENRLSVPGPVIQKPATVAEHAMKQPAPELLTGETSSEQVTPVLKPVFDPKTQALRLEHFYEVLGQIRQAQPSSNIAWPSTQVDRLLRSLDQFFESNILEDTTDVKKAIQHPLLLQQELNTLLMTLESEIRTLESTMNAMQRPNSGNLDELRDRVKLSSLIETTFSEAEKISKNLARSLTSSHQVSEGYSALSSLFHELQHAHFAANAKDQITLTIEQETEAEYPRSKTLAAAVSASLSGGPLLSMIKPSVSGSLGISRQTSVLKDTDGDVDLWVSNKAAMSLGMSVGNLTGILSSCLQGNLECSQGGNYLQARNVKDIMKMFVLDRARNGAFQGQGPLPNYSPENLERGAFNRALIGSLSQQVEHHFGLLGFNDTIRRAYPTAAMLIETKDWFLKPDQQTKLLHSLSSEMTEHQFSPAPKNPLLHIAPMSAPAPASKGTSAQRLWGISYSKQASVSFSAGVKTPALFSGSILPTLGAQVALSGSIQESGFHLERLHEAAAHMALHPSVIKSYPKIFELIFNLSSSFLSQQGNTAPMILSRQFTKALENVHDQQMAIPQQDLAFDHTLYGVPDGGYIPIAIMHSITSPSLEKLDLMTQYATEWTNSYRKFTAAAEVFGARKLGRSASFNSLNAQESEQLTAKNTILQEAFANLLNENEKQRLPQSPRALIAQAYDAYSLAAGHLGVHLGIMNREFARQHHHQGPLPEALISRLDQANQAYADLKDHLDACHVPLDVEFLLRNSSVGAVGKVLQTQKSASTKLSFGPSDVKLNSGIQLPLTQGDLSVSSNPSIGNMAFKLTYSIKEVKKHGNLGRLGIYHDFTFEVDQRMAPGLSMTNSMVDALATQLGHLAQTAGQVQEQEAKSLIGALKDAILVMVRDPFYTDGSLFHVVFHRYPDTESGQTYANKLQASRWGENEKTARRLGGSVPTSILGAASMSLKLEADRLVTRTTRKFFGSDLNTHMMLLPDLMPPPATEVNDLAQLLLEKPKISEKLFGGTGLQELVRDYEAFLNKNDAPDRPKTGFDFYEEPRFSVYAHNMRVLDHYTPGRDAQHILDRLPKQPLVHGYQFESEDIKTLVFHELLPRLEQCRDFEERLAFAIGDGKPLMKTYLGILQHYNELNLAGYQMNYPRQLRHSKSSSSTESIPKLLDQLLVNTKSI